MADIAKKYHDELQHNHCSSQRTQNENERIYQDVLREIPENQKIQNPEDSLLNNLVSELEVERVIQAAKTGSAAGMDGIPYELWKTLAMRHRTKQDKDEETPSFDIVRTLTIVFQDIQERGVNADSNFTLGWMCPIYKKNEHSSIENYRPITLLNSDYKLLTRVLAMQLAVVILSLIHKNQAGFITGRSIFDQTRLAQSIIDYAEATEENGAIIALDQKKAYDKIEHEYLWETLKAFRLPPRFIQTLKSLYTGAKTRIMINGVLSEPMIVRRGTRQGDPVSAFTFDLAIEPLACMVRNSENLNSIQIPNILENVLINLFADDTTVYLGKNDQYENLTNILDSWCLASGAKFNIMKMEIIPIGTEEHRARVITTRRLHKDDPPLNQDIRIANDGHAIRSLGAWIGNKIDDATPWELVLDKIRTNLDRWKLGRPTLDGKRLIVQMVVGGTTQYLAKVQGMPNRIEKALVKVIRDFIWEGNAPRINLDLLSRTRGEGGLDLLDILVCNNAIQIMWLKAYLDLTEKRPTWAFIADALINRIIPPEVTDMERINSFLQTWDIPTQGPRAHNLPRYLLQMLRTAKKYHVNFVALKISKGLKDQMPAWHHLGLAPKHYRKRRNKCLLENHDLSHVVDMVKLARRTENPDCDVRRHHPIKTCVCNSCKEDRRRGCANPNKCSRTAHEILQGLHPKFDPKINPPDDNLTLTHRRREKNNMNRSQKKGKILFDPSVTLRTGLADGFRIFTNPERLSNAPAHRLTNTQRGIALDEETIAAYTDGSCMNNGKANAQSGAGIWISEGHPGNRAIKIDGISHSNQSGELTAVLAILLDAPNYAPVQIRTDSRFVIDGLTKHLRDWED